MVREYQDSTFAAFKARRPQRIRLEFGAEDLEVEFLMLNAVELLRQHFQTLVAETERWQTLIADDAVWELPFAESLGHPARLSGREELVRHANWFAGAVANFRFFDLRLCVATDPDFAVAEIKAEGLIKATERIYQQEYIVFLHSDDGKIKLLREYFDPTRAAKAMNIPIPGLDP